MSRECKRCVAHGISSKGWRFRAGPVVPQGASARARPQVVRCSGVAIRWPHTLLDVELSDREWDDAYAAIDRVFRDPRRVERAYWARACADRAVYNNATPPVDPDLELVVWGKWRVIMATAHFTYQSSAVEWSRSAHDYLDWAWRNGREWAVPTSWFPEDASARSPARRARARRRCGHACRAGCRRRAGS